MRVLFTVSSWRSHYFPMVPLGWALQAAGHEVRVACAPSESTHVTRAGLVPVPILAGTEQLLHARWLNAVQARGGQWRYASPPPHPETGEEVNDLDEIDLAGITARLRADGAAAAERSADSVVAFARDWRPALVVHDPVSFEGPLAGRVLDVPSVNHLWGPIGPEEMVLAFAGLDETASIHDLVQFDGEYVLNRPLTDALARFGLPETPSGPGYVLDPCPASTEPGLTAVRLPIRYLPYNGPGEEPDWLPELTPDRQRICVIWGNSSRQIFGSRALAVPPVVRALAETGAEVLVAANAADLAELGPLPPGVRPMENVPLHLVLPRCDLLVHHGGAGSVMTALATGVPQLAIPHGLDQHVIARRVEAAGVGRNIAAYEANENDIGKAALEILADPAYLRNAAEASRQLRERPAPSEAVGALEDLANHGTTTTHGKS
ncbi:nucleotide disphospho-sugar-binding domain-containing protein [Amycolatopsis halotolerans]|uniref:Nucleotide disphospho-sugar-binding domain-containing protein n=1 Tax=Amycolatopsis halotolerans TaxID=330083 RepID=A0ABV7Q818_9PSEU